MKLLSSDPQAFSKTIADKMLTYAMGRGLESYDSPAVAKIAARLAANDYKFDTLVLGIAESLPFRNRSSAPAVPTTAKPATVKKSTGPSIERKTQQ